MAATSAVPPPISGGGGTAGGPPQMHPEVIQWLKEVNGLKDKLNEYHQLVVQKRAANADEGFKANVNLRLTADLRNVEAAFSKLYSTLRKFEDDPKYGVNMRLIRSYRQNLDQLDKFKNGIFSEVRGGGNKAMRTTGVALNRADETEATKSMTTVQVVDHTDQLLAAQDGILDQIQVAVRTTKNVHLQMADTLDKSIQHLTDIGVMMDNTNDNIIKRTDQINKVRHMSKKAHTCTFAIINIVLLCAWILIIVIGELDKKDE